MQGSFSLLPDPEAVSDTVRQLWGSVRTRNVLQSQESVTKPELAQATCVMRPTDIFPKRRSDGMGKLAPEGEPLMLKKAAQSAALGYRIFNHGYRMFNHVPPLTQATSDKFAVFVGVPCCPAGLPVPLAGAGE